VNEPARKGAAGADRSRGSGSGSKQGSKQGKEKKLSLFGRIARFVRQVMVELKKVVRPSRKDLLGYAAAVLVFVGAVMAFVTLVDLGAGWLAGLIFGN
jgi:preprotein translocase subunit SecE